MVTCVRQGDGFFGPQINVCDRKFDFTLLFEQSILSAAPSALFIIFMLLRIAQLRHVDRKTLPNVLRNVKLLVISLFLCLQIAILSLWTLPSQERTVLSVPASALSVIVAVGLAGLSNLENSRSPRPSQLICTFLLISTLLDVAQTRTLWLRPENRSLAALFTCSVLAKLTMLLLESFEKSSFLKIPYSLYPPEALAGVISRSLFWWLNLVIQRGRRSVLGLGDIFDVDEALSSSFLESRMRASWKVHSENGTHPLLLAIISCFWRPLVALVFPRICLIGFKFSQPFLINRVLSLISNPDTMDNKEVGYALIGATTLIYLGLAVSTAQYRHQIFRVITMLRGGLICLIYDATLELDTNSKGESAAVTLMSTDIERIGSTLTTIDSLWAGPIEAAIAIYLLERELGVACVAPLIISLVCTLGAMSIMKWAKNTQKEWLEAVQKRVAITSAALSSIRGVKMQGLTGRLSDDLQELRVQELEYAKPFRRNIVATAVISNITALCGPAITFITYILVQRAKLSATLNIAQAFTALSLISLLSTPVSELVQTIPSIGAALGCIERIQTYIRENDRRDSRFATQTIEQDSAYELSDTGAENPKESFGLDPMKPGAAIRVREENIIAVKDASFVFSKAESPILTDINLEIAPNTLTIIIGAVGSGKSSLLRGMLGELMMSKGSVFIGDVSIGYCSQSAWLPNGSIQDSILGGLDYEEEWYRTVVNACMLQHDIANLPGRENTVIGSEGAALSGGQKQRVALARALYSRKKVLFIDDIFSGLDSKTSPSLFRNVFGNEGLCKRHKITTIIATHAIQYLPSADNVVVLKDGTILNQGPFEKLQRTGNSYIRELIVHEDSPMDQLQEDIVEAKPSTSVSRSATDDTTRQDGDASVYLYFAKSVGWGYSALFICTVALYTMSSELQAVLLEIWTSAETKHPGVYTDRYMGLYAMLSVLALCGIGGMLCVTLLFAGPYASINLHRKLLHTVFCAPYSWFVATDSGVTLNRFSQDMSLIDMELLIGIVDTFAGSFMAMAQAILIAIGAKYVGVILPLILAILYVLQKVYLKTSRQVRLLDLESKSPLYSHFTETLAGLTTIRAFGWQESFTAKNRRLLDTSQKPYYLLYCIQRWLNLVLDLTIAGIATVLIAFATQMRGTTSAGILGIALVNILQFNTTLSFLIRKWTQLETSIGAVTRVKSLAVDTPSEKTSTATSFPPTAWPTEGKVDFKNVTAAYGASEPVLKNVSFTLEAHQKIGIVGRTASGKSSLLLTMFQMLDLTTGDIFVDNIALSSLETQSFRLSFIAIPQEPYFLVGSVRFNIDPFLSLVNDSVIQLALEKVGLWSLIETNGGLDVPFDEKPLSRGQEQLFCIARALIRKEALGNKDHGILILDEVTSSVDSATEELILRVLSEEFAGWTVFAVSHRLDMVRDYDTILVVDDGKLVEQGTPDELMSREEGRFRQLWESEHKEATADAGSNMEPWILFT